ncbi:MAG TPA: phosphoribosyl-ATP diphosphatase [Pseudolabrys sp.]|nr:phosphoribosyl-ATP diphosphatase [Pseudolabrys sp.]
MADSISRLYAAVLDARGGDPATSRTTRLIRAGLPKAAKKMAEEAVEVTIEAMHGRSDAVVLESADLIYNLVVLWSISGVQPEDVWAEMRRREEMMGIAEKLPKKLLAAAPGNSKVAMLDAGRYVKRR